MKQKREEFRQQIRKQENEKIFQRLRSLINNNKLNYDKMISTEQEFYETLQNQIENKSFDEKLLLNCLNKWDSNFDKKQMTQLLFNKESQYFKFLVANFKMNKKYIRIFIYIFQTLELDISEVHIILNENQLLNHLLNEFSKQQPIIQQQVILQKLSKQLMFFFSVLIQYSQFYRFAIKNSNIIDIILEQFIKNKIIQYDQNFIECFIFMIWSLINPDINIISDLFEWIFDDLLRLFIHLENISSEYLLAIIFKAASSFTFCRYKLFSFDQNQIFQFNNFENKPLIQNEFIQFLNILLTQDPEYFIQYFQQYYFIILQKFLDSKIINTDLKIQTISLLIDIVYYDEIINLLIDNNILQLILNMIQETYNIDLLQVLIKLLSILIINDKNNKDNIDLISKSLSHILFINIQFEYLQIWDIFRYLLNEYQFNQLLIQKLKEYNIIKIIESNLENAKNPNVIFQINECIELLK